MSALPGFRVATWNIHKGFSPAGRRLVVHELRDRLRQLDADIVFLQEVQGAHQRHAMRHADWPAAPQHEFLASEVWEHAAYGRNMVYGHGHHGNAILSRFPIRHQHNQDVTHFRFEKRGLLHCAIDVPGLGAPLHCVCAHLSLFARSRRRQLEALADRVEALVPAGAPLLVAGDFNDWRNQAGGVLAQRLGLTEIFAAGAAPPGRSFPAVLPVLRLTEIFAAGAAPPGRSFPAVLPVLRLDRIYLRGLAAEEARIHAGPPWANISDHAPLSARLRGS